MTGVRARRAPAGAGVRSELKAHKTIAVGSPSGVKNGPTGSGNIIRFDQADTRGIVSPSQDYRISSTRKDHQYRRFPRVSRCKAFGCNLAGLGVLPIIIGPDRRAVGIVDLKCWVLQSTADAKSRQRRTDASQDESPWPIG